MGLFEIKKFPLLITQITAFEKKYKYSNGSSNLPYVEAAFVESKLANTLTDGHVGSLYVGINRIKQLVSILGPRINKTEEQLQAIYAKSGYSGILHIFLCHKDKLHHLTKSVVGVTSLKWGDIFWAAEEIEKIYAAP